MSTSAVPVETSPPAPVASVAGAFDLLMSGLFAPPIRLLSVQARFVLLLAGGFAVWTDVLFYRAGLGVNVTIWFASLLGLVVFAGRRVGRPLPADRIAVLVLFVALSTVIAWRADDALAVFGLLAAWGLLGVGVGLGRNVRALAVSPVAALVALLSCGAALMTSPWRMASRLPASTRATSRVPGVPIVRSLVIALPILLIFGALFAAADAVFAEQIGRLFRFDLSGIVPHVVWLLFGGWFATAAISTAVGVQLPDEIVLSVPERHRLKRFEIAIVLGSLAALFALFVVVQVRYLFGGDHAVQSSVNLTYAEYARRGFFELVVASLLLLPVLATINWARQFDRPSLRQFLALAALLILLLSVIMVSAWQRLAMYWDAFGLTELRFYAAATLPWLAISLGWFVACVARGRIERFVPGAALLAIVMMLGMYVLSPQDYIVRSNLARIEQQKPFDAQYAASLSADAVPALVGSFGMLSADQRCEVAGGLVRRFGVPERQDFRSWNFSGDRALRLLAEHPEVLSCG